jgi:hypothetical protein
MAIRLFNPTAIAIAYDNEKIRGASEASHRSFHLHLAVTIRAVTCPT